MRERPGRSGLSLWRVVIFCRSLLEHSLGIVLVGGSRYQACRVHGSRKTRSGARYVFGTGRSRAKSSYHSSWSPPIIFAIMREAKKLKVMPLPP